MDDQWEVIIELEPSIEFDINSLVVVNRGRFNLSPCDSATSVAPCSYSERSFTELLLFRAVIQEGL